jgi:hypothetical protein
MDRIEMLRKTVPFWLEQEMPVRLVIERREHAAHSKLVREERWKDVQVLPTPLSGKGIAYARKYCVEHADKAGLDAIVMSNDDCYVNPTSDAWLLIDEAEKPDTVGIGAVRSLFDRFTKGAISRNHGPILCPGGWGFMLWGLNIKNALECGNYDPALHCFAEDTEMARVGIAKLGLPWLVHCDVHFTAMNKRYDPGGIESIYHNNMEGRLAAERDCMAIVYKRWPKYANHPDKKSRFAWQKMLDDYIPDWRKGSAIHGGSLDYWDNEETEAELCRRA